MYDASFDDSSNGIRPQRWLWALRLAAVAAVLLATSSAAQIPGTPTLQNAFVAPAGVVAFDYGGGSNGQTYAAALSYAPSSAKLLFAGGYGWRNGLGKTQNGVYGLRLAVPFGSANGSFGFAAFAGVGGGPQVTTTRIILLPVSTGGTRVFAIDSMSSTTQVPVGFSIGWRRFFGGAQGFSIYASPNYVFYSGGTANGNRMRVGLGTDIGISPAVGVSLGVDLGGTREAALGGPSGVLYGVGVSYVFRRQ
jgi:hypothetical protein